MTIAIHQQPRFQKALLVVGLIVAVAGLAFGMTRIDSPERADSPAVVATRTVAGLGPRFEAIQDDYLVPQAILNRQGAFEAAVEAELSLQNGYLPRAVTGSVSDSFLMIQDGYLPPADAAVVAPSAQPTTSARFGPR